MAMPDTVLHSEVKEGKKREKTVWIAVVIFLLVAILGLQVLFLGNGGSLTGSAVKEIEPEVEIDTLKTFWRLFMAEREGSKFVGFNIESFDLPFLIRRSWHHSIHVPAMIYKGRWLNDAWFIDLKKIWTLVRALAGDRNFMKYKALLEKMETFEANADFLDTIPTR